MMHYFSKYSAWVLIALYITACSNPTDEGTTTGQNTPSIQNAKAPKNDEPTPEVLTDKNATDFLKKYGKENQAQVVSIETPMGNIKIKLYENTPLHRANFLYLTEKQYFDDTWFYRVSKDHVIQGGNTDGTQTIKKRNKIGEYTVPAEMNRGHFHKYGAVAMARSYYQNPEKASDPFEFYIILGKSYTRRELELLAEKHGMTFTPTQLDFYSHTKGSPHLDGEHTVFGEVIEGMDVVEAINQVEVDEGEWPLVNLPIKVKVIR